MAGHRVADGVQVTHEGRTFGPGEPVADDVPADVLAEWLRVGWVEPVKGKQSRRS